jgi:serine/threonine-protein kinase
MNAPAQAPPPGSVIAGKYRIERQLGAGGMAVVVEATHAVLGQRVAIKLLRADAARSPSVLERFRQEAQIAAQLPGDHIVRVTDVGQTEHGEPFLVMELLVGRDLEQELIARGWFPMEEAIDVILQACEGVAEAHAVGLVHRDLKPSNLFVMRRRDGSPHVKVLDFGISKLTTRDESMSLTQATDNFGTPLYMSPEQIQSVKHVDARSDQHSLGAILFTMLAARPPWTAPTVTALSVVIATEPPPSLRLLRSDIPARLDAAIARALAKQPGDRFADLAAFADALAPFGSAGSVATVRRIASALMSAPPPHQSNLTMRPGYGGPLGGPPAALSDPGFASAEGQISGVFPLPGRRPSVPEASGAFPTVPMRGPPFGQTSAALAAPLSGERAGHGSKRSLAIAVVGLCSVTVALFVWLALVQFGPKRGEDGVVKAPAASAGPSLRSLAEALVKLSAAPPSGSAPASESSAGAPGASPAEAQPAATAEPSGQPSSATAPGAPPAQPYRFGAQSGQPVSGSGVKQGAPKKKDPSEVFGARR